MKTYEIIADDDDDASLHLNLCIMSSVQIQLVHYIRVYIEWTQRYPLMRQPLPSNNPISSE